MKGIILILLGIAGIVFICNFDLLMKKPVNDFIGPKSIIGFIIFGIVIFMGIRSLAQKKK